MKIGQIKLNSHKNHNPNYDILCKKLDDNTIITYCFGVNEEIYGKQICEIYKGENYVVGSTKRSYSRVYHVGNIPNKYMKEWIELKNKYIIEYKK